MLSSTPPAPVLAVLSPPTQRRWPPAVWALLAITFVARAAGFTYPFLGYHLKDMGFTTTGVGQVLAAFGTGWLIGQLLTGWGADRFGRRRTLISAMTTAVLCLPVLAQSHTFSAVITGSFIVGIVYDAPRPIVSAAIADLVNDDAQRTAINGLRHGAVNVGAAITGIAGGFLASTCGFQALFWFNAAACGICALIAHRHLGTDATTTLRQSGDRPGFRSVVRDSRLWLLWAASVAALTCAAGMFTALPLLMEDDGLPVSAYGWTQVANAAAVFLLTPILSPWLSRRCAAQRPMLGMLAASALLLGAGMGGTGLADTTWGYSLAVFVAVPGEIIFFIAASDVLDKISPEPARGIYAGVWGSTLAVAVIAAPILATASLNSGGEHVAALTTLAAGVLGAALCLLVIPLTHRRSAAAVPPPPPPPRSVLRRCG
ncbi:MFS transporter [Streptomyces chryseus]